ncbi:MAG: hypothetical protein IJX01_02275 [Oscillospiraceae bacterium]|nr:hypothetical protein [Oscillospiraceae bacterium]
MNTNKLSPGNKIGIIVIVSVLLLLMVLFAFLLINSIIGYSQYDIAYSDLIYQELTFERYERIPQGKSGYAYDIYFKEYEAPFRIHSFVRKKVDKVALSQLDGAPKIQVYLHQLSDKNGDYFQLCEMRYNNTSILSMSDYVKANQNNLLLGVGLCSFFILDCLFLLWMFTRMFKKRTREDCGIQADDDLFNN